MPLYDQTLAKMLADSYTAEQLAQALSLKLLGPIVPPRTTVLVYGVLQPTQDHADVSVENAAPRVTLTINN